MSLTKVENIVESYTFPYYAGEVTYYAIQKEDSTIKYKREVMPPAGCLMMSGEFSETDTLSPEKWYAAVERLRNRYNKE